MISDLRKIIAHGFNYTESIEIPIAEAEFSNLYHMATQGFELIIHESNSDNVSILSTEIVTAMLNTIKFTIKETEDKELGSITIAIAEVPLYGEGVTRDAAINDLIDSTIEFLDIYKDQIAIYNKYDNVRTKIYMLKLLRCGADRGVIKRAYGL